VTTSNSRPPFDPSMSSGSDSTEHVAGRVETRDKLTISRRIDGRVSTRTIVDMIFGALVMGTVGMLIGLLMGSGFVLVAASLGVSLGTAVGFFGGRRFLVSILAGTVGGGALAWAVAGVETASVGAGAGAAMGGFFGVWISMVLDMWAERRRPRGHVGEVEPDRK